MFARQLGITATALSLISVSAWGAEREVSSAADITAAARIAAPGDVIVMRDGLWKDADILFDCQGAADAPIILRARSPGKVILSGRSRLRIAGANLVVEGLWFKDGYPSSGDVIAFRADSAKLAHHCRVTNCAVTDYNPPNRKLDSKWISLYGTHNRVDHCELVGKENAGTTLVVWLSGVPNHHQIDHNYFGARPVLGANGGETIRVGTSEWSMSESRTVVEHNLFQECSGEIEIISNKSCENIYRYNTFLNCEGALTLRHGNRCTVHGNFFLGNSNRNTGGVRIIGEDHRIYNNYFADLDGEGARSALSMMDGVQNSPLNGYFQVKRAIVAFNTFVNCRSSLTLGITSAKEGGLPPEDCTIANNVVWSDKGPLVKVMGNPTGLRWQANVMYGATLGIQPTAGIEVVNPNLGLAADGLWRPLDTSVVLGGAAKGYSFVTDDIDGHLRGSELDIGCDQVLGGTVQRRPLDSKTVGLTWSTAP